MHQFTFLQIMFGLGFRQKTEKPVLTIFNYGNLKILPL